MFSTCKQDLSVVRVVGVFELCRTLLQIAPRYSKCLHCRNCNAYFCSCTTCRHFRMRLPLKNTRLLPTLLCCHEGRTTYRYISCSPTCFLLLLFKFYKKLPLGRWYIFQVFITIQNTRIINQYTSRYVNVVPYLHGRHVDTNDTNNKIKAQTQSSFDWKDLRTRFHGNIFTA